MEQQDNWMMQIKKGILPFVVLLIIRKQDSYGYSISMEIEKVLGFEVADGTIYPILMRLCRENMLESYWVQRDRGMPRKYYKITKTGEEYLNKITVLFDNMIVQIKEFM